MGAGLDHHRLSVWDFVRLRQEKTQWWLRLKTLALDISWCNDQDVSLIYRSSRSSLLCSLSHFNLCGLLDSTNGNLYSFSVKRESFFPHLLPFFWNQFGLASFSCTAALVTVDLPRVKTCFSSNTDGAASPAAAFHLTARSFVTVLPLWPSSRIPNRCADRIIIPLRVMFRWLCLKFVTQVPSYDRQYKSFLCLLFIKNIKYVAELVHKMLLFLKPQFESTTFTSKVFPFAKGAFNY